MITLKRLFTSPLALNGRCPSLHIPRLSPFLKLHLPRPHPNQCLLPPTPFSHSRRYNFASLQYSSSFLPLPTVDTATLRTNTITYLKQFDPNTWYSDPVTTILNGIPNPSGNRKKTYDNFNKENGEIITADSTVVDAVISHMRTYKPPQRDYRKEVRSFEESLLSEWAPFLVGNQALDFRKQDGITEIEESAQASVVERKMNDLLIQDEEEGMITIRRDFALVGCVSNFSNYLDLFRKVLRNIELGVPVVIFSRTNTTQHMYRWAKLLLQLMKDNGVDVGMVTYLACDIGEQRRLMVSFPDSPMYFTGSRGVAAAIKEICPKLMASTGGPNTMIVDGLDGSVQKAVRMSAAIENSGQCTALRHLVVNDCAETDITGAFDDVKLVASSAEALQQGEFAAIFKDSQFDLTTGYKQHPSGIPVAYKISSHLPPDIDEHWRKVYLDVTKVGDLTSNTSIKNLSEWLNTHQPITLAVNMKTHEESYNITKSIFERTSLVVYNIGSMQKPALTAQARPQDAEIFGEFPTRNHLSKITKYPVIVPSSTPSYNSYYTMDFLLSSATVPLSASVIYLQSIISQIENDHLRGYANILINYLIQSSSHNPRPSNSSTRTGLWGLQRPPEGQPTVFRLNLKGVFDYLSVYLLPFLMMEGGEEAVEVSCDPDNLATLKKLEVLKELKVTKESNTEFENRMKQLKPWNLLTIENEFEYPLVGHFVSLLLPLGHVKSTLPNDKAFIDSFTPSKKWYKIKQL